MHRGEPIKILSIDKEDYELHTDALEKILLSDKVRNRKVAIVSIAGELRGGKSFMLNFFLRYLEAEGSNEWIGNNESSLEGFSWKNGPYADTSGIIMWSEPYIVTNSVGEEYAILLMDTQGTFDHYTSTRTNTLLFAMTTLMSSVLIFNVNRILNEIQLQVLHIFLSYGRLASQLNGTESKRFQKMQVLVRDWQSSYSFPFGLKGGTEYIEFVLQSDNKDEKLRCMRQYLKDCFETIECCLLPHPGKRVSGSKNFNGKLSEIDEDFIEELKEYVPSVLSTKNLKPTSIDGICITGLEALEFFKAYFKVFNSTDIPKPQEVFQATVEGGFNSAIKSCKLFYKEEMGKIINETSKFLTEKQFNDLHKRISDETIEKFKDMKKIGGHDFEEEYIPILNSAIEEGLEVFSALNQGKKNISEVTKTLGVIVTSYIALYLLQGVFNFIGIDTVSNLIGFILYTLVTMLALWIGASFLNKDNVRLKVEEVASIIYDNVFVPLIASASEYAVKQNSRAMLAPTSR